MRAWLLIGLSLWNAAVLALDLDQGISDGRINQPAGLHRELRYLAGPVEEHASRDLGARLAGAPWQPVSGGRLPQRSDRIYWFLLSLSNNNPKPAPLMLEFGHPRQRLLNVYLIGEGRLLRRLETGSGRAFASRPLPHPHFMFPLILGPEQDVDVLVQVQGRPAAVPEYLSLWTRNAWFAHQAEAYARDWLLIGFLGAIVVYQLAVFALVRQPVHLACAAYTGAGLGLLLSHFGYGFHFLWPGSPWLDGVISGLLPSLLAVSGTLFSIHFLAWSRYRPRLVYGCHAACLSLLGLTLAGPILGSFRAAAAWIVETSICAAPLCHWLLASERAWRSRDPGTCLFAAGWALPAAVSLSPSVDFLHIDREDLAYQAALLIQSALFALALAGRAYRLSERRRAAFALGAAQIELRESSYMLLRSSLRSIQLLAGSPPGGDGSRRLQNILRIARRLTRRLDNTDDAAALLHGRLETLEVQFDLADMARQALEDARPSGTPGPLLYGIIDPGLPLQWIGDARRLRSLLTDLLERVTETAGPGEAMLRLCGGLCGDCVSGRGRQSGLMLTINASAAASLLSDELRRLVSILGGRVGVRRARMAELWIWLPLRACQQASAAVAYSPGCRVLLVHPNRNYRLSLAEAMRGHGHAVDGVADRTAALALFEASQRGDQRYDWLVTHEREEQAGGERGTASRLLAEIRLRWPASAMRGMVLFDGRRFAAPVPDVTGWVAVKRPLLCNDVVALLRAHAQEQRPGSHSSQALPPIPARERILMATVDVDLRNALSVLLTEYGCSVTLSELGRPLEYSYRRSLRRKSTEFGIVMLCGGELLVPEVRHLCRFETRNDHPPIPVLVVTGQGLGPDTVRRLLRAGATQVLEQPITSEILIRLLAQWSPAARHQTPATSASPAHPADDRSRWNRPWPD